MLLLSQGKLTAFLTCQRRFQLRYLEQRPWPEAPPSPADEERMRQGQQFHQLAQRHFLGLNVEPATIADHAVRHWWLTFTRHHPPLPPGRVLPELTLTVPIGAHLLHGRFDLLILGEKEGASFAHVFDWKTGRPQAETTLRHDWQTRLYLAMLAEGAQALGGTGHGRSLRPDHIAITYWYVPDAEASCTITYSQPWHEQNWAQIQAIVGQIERQQEQDVIWPLTPDQAPCRVCAYQAVCERQEAGPPLAAPAIDDPEAEEKLAFLLEPDLP